MQSLRKISEPVNLAHLSLCMGSALLVFVSSILLIATLSFTLGYSISEIEIYFAMLVTVLFVAWAAHQYFKDSALKYFGVMLLFLGVLIGSVIVFSGKFYDLSYDGQTYHQEAIIQMANGWNPLYKDISPEVHSHSLAINSYSKGAWVMAAALYKITGHIEQSKAINFLFILISFFISLSALLNFHKIKIRMAVLLSCLLALNPVSICQSLSFYVDGQLSSVLITLASLSYLLFKKPDRLTLMMTALVILVGVNIKFTGVIFLLIFVFGAFIFFWYCGKTRPGLKMFLVPSLGFLVGIILVGYSPYVKNALYHSHPFYPLAGSKSIDIISYNMPDNFLRMSRFEKLFLSIFSNSENVFKPSVSRLKWPFTVSNNEFNTFGAADTRVGGWGPMFGGATIISMVIMFIALRVDLAKTKTATGVSLLIMISVIVNPESWWARYSPQLWIIPITFVILSKYIQKRLLKHLGYILILVLVINVILISSSYLRWQYHMNSLLKQQLLSVVKQQDQVLVNFGDFKSNRVRFNELGIKYKEIKEFECLKYTQLISSNSKICIETP